MGWPKKKNHAPATESIEIQYLKPSAAPERTSTTDTPRPAVDWEANDQAQVYQLLDILLKYDILRRGLWPARGDKSVGRSKALLQREVTRLLLKTLPKYQEHDIVASAKYGDTVKQKK